MDRQEEGIAISLELERLSFLESVSGHNNQANHLFTANKDERIVVVCSGFIAVIASERYVAETSALQHEDQLMLTVVFDLLRMDFFLKQLAIFP